MKNILIFFFFLLTVSAFAQPVVNLKAKPNGASEFVSGGVPSFSFSEPIKLVIDVSGVPSLVGVEPIYLWGFIEGCCGSPLNSTNDQFSNSSDAAIMVKVSPNVWSYVIPSVKSYISTGFKSAKDAAAKAGTSGYGPQPVGVTALGFLVKNKNGSAQSANINIPFTGPIYIKEEFETFPLNSSQTDVVTITYNQDLEDNATMKTQQEVFLYATADLVGGGNLEPFAPAVVGNTTSLKLAKNGNQYTISIIPTSFFVVPAGKQIDKINVLLRSKADPNINFGATKQIKIVKIK